MLGKYDGRKSSSHFKTIIGLNTSSSEMMRLLCFKLLFLVKRLSRINCLKQRSSKDVVIFLILYHLVHVSYC